jgi:hypothetical protein
MLPERRYTVSAWLLAVLPLVLVAAAWALATYVPLLYTTFIQAILIVLFLSTSVALGALDRRSLHIEGHDSTAAPALALLTPLAFLLARAVLASRETGRNASAPLWVLLAVLAAIAAALLLVNGLAQLLVSANGLY